MDIFEKNLKVIGEKAPGLAARLRDPGVVPIEMERTRSGDFTFSYNGRYFHSRYEPAKEAEAQAVEILDKKFDWVILFGLGCGYLLRKLVEGGKEKIIVYEPNIGILKGVFGVIDLTDISEKKEVHITSEADAVTDLVKGSIDGMDDILSYQTPPYRNSFAGQIADLGRRVRNAHTSNKIGISTEITSRLDWVENYFANIRSFFRYPAVDILDGKFKGVPMVIAGAGPSLNRNAHVLKEFRDRIIVVAAITAFKPLLKHGIVPDMVVAAEKRDLPEFFTHGPDDLKTRFLLADVSNNRMLERETGGKFVYFSPYSRLSVEQAGYWGCDYFPASGGSVTTVALDIGAMFGCDPVIFIGQDLSYSDGKTHADESFYHMTEVRIDEERKVVEEGGGDHHARDVKELFWLKGLDGKPVPSRYDWVIFHQWFERKMDLMKKEGKGPLVINATEGGAYIEGMVHTTLREALGRHVAVPVDVAGIMDEAVSHRPPVDTAGLKASFEKALESIKEIRRLSALILKTARGIKNRLKGGLSPEFTSRIDKIKRLESRLFDATGDSAFIWETLSAYTYILKEYLREEEEGTTEEQFERNLKSLIDSYGKFEEMSGRFIPVLEKAIETVNEEEAAMSGCIA